MFHTRGPYKNKLTFAQNYFICLFKARSQIIWQIIIPRYLHSETLGIAANLNTVGVQ